tara:strand:- start:394 stop:1098 length:705 start_codon:yes stop_codon:yes gene_type:complete
MLKSSLIASGVTITLLLSGCSTMSKVYYNVEKSIEDKEFNERVNESQMHIREAQALLFETEYEQAKYHLDQAFKLFPRQASLHSTYQQYYELLGNEELAHLASKRYENMVVRSDALNRKGRIAMVEMEKYKLAKDLFSLSLIYHDENTSTLVNIATLGLTTHDYELADVSLRLLSKMGHQSPEASLIEYLVAQHAGDNKRMDIVKLIMKINWPESKQFKFIDNQGGYQIEQQTG